MGSERGPQPLSRALSELITLRGIARVQGDRQLQAAWAEAAGDAVAQRTRAVAIRRAVLHVSVGNAPLLSELAAFRKGPILQALQSRFPDLRVRDLKFRLDGSLKARPEEPAS
jgi:predicted nucleic acid-binding Zn ribbon protein